MFANKSFHLFAIAATFILLATVKASPAAEAAEPAACVPCRRPPPCDLECRGGYCIIDKCLCAPKCRKGIPPAIELP
ncbi:hypothetical protein BG000_006177 [Podila horticola]|nr:hypothetical protein BG000_006177 [Podila horticola]